MKNLRELLRDGDPLRHEPTSPMSQRDSRRRAVLAAASVSLAPAGTGLRARIGVFATVVLMLVAATVLGSLLWSALDSNLQAAIRFEVRLAETKPAPGLQKAKVPDSHRWIYLHNEVVVSNSDIAAVRVVQTGGPSQYAIGIEFNAAGADKMRAATQKHIGKPMAVLLDGQVVMAPVLRSSIGASAEITGKFTKAEAENIVKRIIAGIGTQ